MVGNKNLLLIFMFLPWINACGAVITPQKGDLDRTDAYRADVKSLIDRGTLSSKAETVYLEIHALPQRQQTESLKITPEQYKGMLQNVYVWLRRPMDDFSFACENITQTAVWYTAYMPTYQALVKDNYKLSMREAECVRIQDSKIQVVAGIYNFNELLSTQVPDADRHQCLEAALKRYSKGLPSGQTDASIWEYSDMLVGEAAGYVYHYASGPIPHLTFSTPKDHNYYRLVLIGGRTIVALDVIYPLSMPLDKLQIEVLPIIKALRYTTPPTE